ncbi:MAG TPA: Ig-like domain-containing protein, partial [Burkholderiaceae bacterium]|nr:Ig-like domain-containing protein [Burkholderiaceae bacterium]
MNKFVGCSRFLPWLTALLFSALAAGCGGGSDSGQSPILGSGGVKSASAPTVTSVTPLNLATAVATGNAAISATFSTQIAPITGSSSFILSCSAPCVNPSGTVALDSTNQIATFTLAPATTLAPLTLYTATITGAQALAGGAALAIPYTWQFTTAAAPAVAPTVTAVAPINNATGVPVNSASITAAFSVPVAALTGNASFTLTCAAPCVNPVGTVTLDSTSQIASFNLNPASALAPLTVYTATVSGVSGLGSSLGSGLSMTSPYSWTFTTGAATSVTRPGVSTTVPATTLPGPTTGVQANTAISAVFTTDMAPLSINASSFTLTCSAPCIAPTGTVSYAVGTRSAVFTPTAALASGTTYTATITTAATDLAGNALGGNTGALPASSNYVWTFTTSGVAAPANVSVLSTNPLSGSSTLCTSAGINATFSVPAGLQMNPTTINAATFTVTGPALTPVTASSVVLDTATGTIATFTPKAPLTAGVSYTATIIGGSSGVKDLAVPADTMLSNFSWNFTAETCAATGSGPAAIPLGSAATFGTFGGSAGMTSQGLKTVVNGNIGTTAVSTSVTGFHDAGPGCVYTQTPLNIGTVNGLIYTAPPSPTGACQSEGTATTFSIASQARADALIAYNALVAEPGGPDPGAGNLGNLTLAPGVYTSKAGSFMIQGGNLTLDAQGNANAVWVFQMATTLTVGGPGAAAPQSIILANGAQAKNVYWQVGSAATINAG